MGSFFWGNHLLFTCMFNSLLGWELGCRFSWGKLRKRENLEDVSVDGRIILKLILKTWDELIDWIDLLSLGTSGGLLDKGQRNFGFHWMQRTFRLAEVLEGSQERLCSFQLFSWRYKLFEIFHLWIFKYLPNFRGVFFSHPQSLNSPICVTNSELLSA
jgi:hypothetical protein